MDDHSTSPPVGLQHGRRVGWGRIHIEPDRPQGVSTVYEDITQAHRRGETRGTESPLRRHAESIGQLRDGHVTETLGGLAHRSVRSQSTSKDVTRHRQGRRLSPAHKMGEHVAHPPTRTPGGGVPRRLIERLNPVGEPATQTSHLVAYLPDLHDS
jgi:hypothetical protein